MKEFKKFLKDNRTIIGYFLFICVVPALIYLIWFFNNGFSRSPEHWAQFGDYFGGIVNPIIGIGSILILGYISVKLGKDATEKQRELFYHQERVLSYRELNQNYLSFLTAWDDIRAINKRINFLLKNKSNSETNPMINEIYQRRLQLELEFNHFKLYIKRFSIANSNLFKYDFNSDKHKELVDSVSILINRLLLLDDSADADEQSLRDQVKTAVINVESLIKTLLLEI